MLSTSNPRVVDFYGANPGIDFEQANLWLIEMLEALLDKKNSNESATLMQKEFSHFMQSSSAQLDQVRSGISALHDSVNKNNHEMKSHIMTQLFAMKREYLDDIKPVLENQALTLNEKWSCITEKNATFFTEKLSLLLNDQMPKLFHSPLREMHLSLKSELDTLSLRKDKSIDDFTHSFEVKYTNMLKSLEPVYASITDMKSTIAAQHSSLSRELGDFTAKFRSSSIKGKCSENLLSSVLHSLFPSGQIDDTTGIKHSGDCILSRPNVEHSIMFENKIYERNVEKVEVEKFVRDVDHLRMHSILISQKSGIAMKQNFQIEIHKGLILLFIHRAEYSHEKIQLAVDIIDHLSARIAEIDHLIENPDNSHIVKQEILDLINDDYASFVHKRESLFTLIHEFTKNITKSFEDIRLPNLEEYLKTKYSIYSKHGGASSSSALSTSVSSASSASSSSSSSSASSSPGKLVCDICGNFSATNKSSMAAHKRGKSCKKHLLAPPSSPRTDA